MISVWCRGGLLLVAGSLAGCSIGGIGSFVPVAASVPSSAVPPPVSYGSFLEGPVGQKLSAADRDKALAAEQDASASGQRRTWRGDHGIYGYVEPGAGVQPAAVADGTVAGPPSTTDTCRTFTSTVYISGRPQVGHGRGCPMPDGSYHIVG